MKTAGKLHLMVSKMVLRACRTTDYVLDRARDDGVSVGHERSEGGLGAALDIRVHSGQVVFGAVESLVSEWVSGCVG